MVKRFLKEGGRDEGGQRRVWDGSRIWHKKRALFSIQENQETVKEDSTLVGLIPNFSRVIEMMCRTFAPNLVMVSVPKIGIVLIGPLLGCGGDGYGGALLAREKILPVVFLLRGRAEVMGDGGAPSVCPLHAPGEGRGEEGEEKCVREEGSLFIVT